MFIPGHLSAGYLAAAVSAGVRGRAPRLRTEILPVTLGALTPDLIDKSAEFVGIYGHSRGVGHSLVFLAAVWIGWRLLRRWGSVSAHPVAMWVLGIASHLAADLTNDIGRAFLYARNLVSSWFAWPWATPDGLEIPLGFTAFPDVRGLTPFEVMLTAVAVLVAVRLHR